MTPYEVLESLVGELDRETVREARRARFLELADAAPLCDGVLSWLDDAKALGLGVGLATSSPRSWIDRHLPRLGIIERFDCIVTRDDVEFAKPAPDLYLNAVARLGVQPREAVAIEDSPNGVLAARRAGLRTVAVPNPTTAALTFDADVTLPALSWRDLQSVLDELFWTVGRRP